MFCVNPENGYLAVKALSSNGICDFSSLYTAQEMAQQTDQITNQDTVLVIAAVCGVYGSVFIIKLVLQLLGYRY